jgi:poly(3-hydroxybutyrate) depolymerase
MATGPAGAAQGAVLPAWVCSQPDAVFVGGFESDTVIVRQPSQGSGGSYPGDVTRHVAVSGLGSQTYYLHLPSNYAPGHSWPLMLLLHGSAGPGTSDRYAKQVRSDWASLADAQGFILASPVGTDSQGGGWVQPQPDGQGPSDYDTIAAALADAAAQYNLEETRVYAWGYSAGGEVLDDIVLTGWSGLDADYFAGYAVTGTALAGCPTYTSIQSCAPSHAVRVIPVDIHIGSADPIYTQGYAASDVSAFVHAGWTLASTLFYTVFTDGTPPGGHTYSAADLQQVWTNLCPQAVVH